METKRTRNSYDKCKKQILDLLKQRQLYEKLSIDDIGDATLDLAVKFTLDKGIDLDNANEQNKTILFLAILKRAKDVIEFLITRYKVQFDSSIAVDFIHDEINKFSELKKKAEMTDDEIQIMENESATFVEWLISKGFDFDYKSDDTSKSALEIAIDHNLEHILLVLLKHTRDIDFVDGTDRNLFHLFMLRRNTYRHKIIDRFWYSNRYTAAIAKILLDRGVPPDAEDKTKCTPIRLAVEKNKDIDVVKLLFERLNNVNQTDLAGETLFNTVIRNLVELRSKSSWSRSNERVSLDRITDYMWIANALIAKSANVNIADNDGKTPLYHAIRERDLLVVKLLQKNGADFSATTDNGKTLLHLLMEQIYRPNDTVDIELFDILLENGCELMAEDQYGNTPLHIAAVQGNATIVQKLLELGADANYQNNQMETPIYSLVVDNSTYRNYLCDMVFEMLLKYGANVNARNFEGNTPFDVIVDSRDFHSYWRESDSKRIRFLQSLLKCGADFDTKDFSKVPFISMETNNCKVEEFLLKHSIKLEVAHLQLNTTIKHKEYRKKCLEEIERFQSTFIDDHTSLYRLLHTDPNRRGKYIENEKLKQLLSSSEFEKKFPECSVLIFASYYEAVTRKIILEPAKTACLKIFNIRLPPEIIEHILSFSRNSDLFNIIDIN